MGRDLSSIPGDNLMACPFFMPTRKSDRGSWQHVRRLPLGAGWEGHCTAPGNEGVVPELQQVVQGCNLGYASECPHLPAQRSWDAVRFCVAREHPSAVFISYVCERSHLPGEHGTLQFRLADRQWVKRHSDERIQRMAQCYLDSWLVRTAQASDAACERPL